MINSSGLSWPSELIRRSSDVIEFEVDASSSFGFLLLRRLIAAVDFNVDSLISNGIPCWDCLSWWPRSCELSASSRSPGSEIEIDFSFLTGISLVNDSS